MSLNIIIPTHNRTNELENALNSLNNQTRASYTEVIIVDDGSTKPVAEDVLVKTFQKLKLKVIRNDKPLGANNARNQGILEAKSDWIAFPDDDDELIKNTEYKE
ncbi:MAG: glycosyltransferase family A protein [Bacteroidota bacterium]|nr:glycosyltransferase family A protein [Bacteroidota bacterium]